MNRPEPNPLLTRIGIFYDGNFFLSTSNYFNFEHDRQSRLSISGIHRYVCEMAKILEDSENAQIVDAHFFRGRLSTRDAQDKNRILADRILDEILMNEAVTTHYLPVQTNRAGYMREKGVDVLLALEALESVVLKQYDILVLFVCDSDYVPLVKKVNAFGTRVMVLGCDFEFTDMQGREKQTYTSQRLLQTATYPIMINEVVDADDEPDEKLVDALFVRGRPPEGQQTANDEEDEDASYENQGNTCTGVIGKLKKGFGFIFDEGGSELFFHKSDLIGCNFWDLQEQQKVAFVMGQNDQGDCAAEVRLID